MTTHNPFPGMNPFFEQRWKDAHTRLIAYICDALQEQLPEDLVAGAEEELLAIGAGPQPARMRPDVSVKQPWESAGNGGVAVLPRRVRAPLATVPRRVLMLEEIRRWVEIHDDVGRLVTVIELLSPSNKASERDRYEFRKRRSSLLSGGVNVVEIDLLRGPSVFSPEISLEAVGAAYGACVFCEGENEVEFYPVGFRDPLPVISIPLRKSDPDVPLDLQPLINQCHERGRYHRLRYDLELHPPPPPDDAAWTRRVLRDHGLLK